MTTPRHFSHRVGIALLLQGVQLLPQLNHFTPLRREDGQLPFQTDYLQVPLTHHQLMGRETQRVSSTRQHRPTQEQGGPRMSLPEVRPVVGLKAPTVLQDRPLHFMQRIPNPSEALCPNASRLQSRGEVRRSTLHKR
jgi:hypothetical protein